MPITKIWVFETFEAADKARDALIASGLEREDVVFSNRQEEAGPVEGNWMLPPSNEGQAEKKGFFHSLVGSSDEASDNYAKADVTQRGSFLLTFNARDDTQLREIEDALRRSGGTDINDRTP